MKFTSRDVLKSALGEFFRDNFYQDGVINLRRAVRKSSYYRENWESVVRLIIHRKLKRDEPLHLIHDVANLPLDENSDEEAYRWLNLMLINSMGSEDAMIIKY